MARGDHIRVRRRGYWHHGIDCGDGSVIHYTGELKNSAHAAVSRTSMATFIKDGMIEVVRAVGTHDPDEIMSRAESRLGETRYRALNNNCEHFAHWCRSGSPKSRQVRRVLAVAASGVVAGATVLAVGASLLLRRTKAGRF